MALPKNLQAIKIIQSENSTFDGEKTFTQPINGTLKNMYFSAAGDVKVSTQADGDSSTNAANTEFVQNAINALKGEVVEDLNTLDKLAKAMGDDPEFISKLEEAIALKSDDTAVVHRVGAETIDGTKTFNDAIAADITGNAATATHATKADEATKALQDGDGNVISETYVKIGSSSSGGEDGEVSTFIDGLQTNTAAAGDNSQKVATTEFVQTAVAGLVDSAPETLDTLKELSAALGDDPNFAATITESIGKKANDDEVLHLTGNETIAGTKTFSDPVVADITGNAATADKAKEADKAASAAVLASTAIVKKSWQVNANVTGNDVNPAVVNLPSGVTYEPGKNQILSLIYNGAFCAIDFNYKEGDGSNIKLLFDVAVDDIFEITILKTVSETVETPPVEETEPTE